MNRDKDDERYEEITKLYLFTDVDSGHVIIIIQEGKEGCGKGICYVRHVKSYSGANIN